MSKAEKTLEKMRSNPKDDWTPENVKALCNAYGVKLRQNGTNHAVLTNRNGDHLTIPMNKPVKPIYIRQLVELIDSQNENEEENTDEI